MPTLDKIADVVCRETGQDFEALTSPQQTRDLQVARALFAGVAHAFGFHPRQIGEHLGRLNADDAGRTAVARAKRFRGAEGAAMQRILLRLGGARPRGKASNGVSLALVGRPYAAFDVSPDAIRPDCRVSAEAFEADRRPMRIDAVLQASPEGSSAFACLMS